MKCTSCGKVLPENSRVCGFCGAKLDTSKKANDAESNLAVPVSAVIDSADENKAIDKDTENAQMFKATAIIYKEETHFHSESPQVIFKRYKPMTTAGFFFTDLALKIPLLNIILLFVWSFRKNSNRNRSAYARSKLIWIVLSILVTIGIGVAVGIILYSKPNIVNQLSDFYNYTMGYFAPAEV